MISSDGLQSTWDPEPRCYHILPFGQYANRTGRDGGASTEVGSGISLPETCDISISCDRFIWAIFVLASLPHVNISALQCDLKKLHITLVFGCQLRLDVNSVMERGCRGRDDLQVWGVSSFLHASPSCAREDCADTRKQVSQTTTGMDHESRRCGHLRRGHWGPAQPRRRSGPRRDADRASLQQPL